MYFCPKKQNNFQYILKEKNTFQHLSPSVNIEPVSDGLKRELQITSDGSHTLYMPDMDEHYHSVNGAIQESEHVFIEAGLHRLSKKEIRVLEIGFGTGLNAFLTLLDSRQADRHITYYSMELYPLDIALVQNLNYGKVLCAGEEDMFMALHEAPWNQSASITPNFTLHKMKGDCNQAELPNEIDLVYFDAFAPDKQPEMWNQELFNKLYFRMNEGGILTTYCAKGAVRRTMKESGFSVERIPGPPGKREMLRATKL